MEESKAPPKQEASGKPAAAGSPIIHRVCEACNNMFVTHPGDKQLRCPNCRKE